MQGVTFIIMKLAATSYCMCIVRVIVFKGEFNIDLSPLLQTAKNMYIIFLIMQTKGIVMTL